MELPRLVTTDIRDEELSTSYHHVSEYIADELQRLDFLIRRALVKHEISDGAGQSDRFRGLVITEEEIDRLMCRRSADADGVAADNRASTTLAALEDELSDLDDLIRVKLLASENNGVSIPFSTVEQTFGLTASERFALLVALAPELDRRYETLYAYLHDDITRKLPTPGLVMDLLGCSFTERIETRKSFDPSASLFSHRLLSFVPTSPDQSASLLSRPLRIDERVASFLLGSNAIDPRISDFARLCNPGESLDCVTLPHTEISRLRWFVRSQFSTRSDQGRHLVLHLHGPRGTGRKSLANVLCHDLGMQLLVADIVKAIAGETSLEELVERLCREAVMQNAALCIERIDQIGADDQRSSRMKILAETLPLSSGLTFLVGGTPWKDHDLFGGAVFLTVEFPVPADDARRKLWEHEASCGMHIEEGVDFGALSSRFRFTPGQVRGAMSAAANRARWRHPEQPQIHEDDIYAASRDHSNGRLNDLARKIIPRQCWDDLVLPENQMEQLRELCNQSRYRHVVYGEWGFERKLSYGKGLSALFTGPPGTGKTMAAEVIARDLQLDLYKIDLSQVVSKYIGETEKNLDRIFSEARTSNAILFFDEADALFGKRSEVKDAHDRYANIEIGYLLQKMEEFEGIAILATNLRGNLDEAFVRRLQHVVEFPLPAHEERRQIWTKVWPDSVPLQPGLDLDSLAQRFEISGGSIKNIALAAAFLAADGDGAIEMYHLLRAARREFQKMGKIVSESEFGGV